MEFSADPDQIDGQFPKTVVVTVTYRCNLSCLMCESGRAELPQADPEQLLQFFSRLAAWLPRPRVVLLTGGEPLLHPRLIDFVKRLAEHEFTAALNTNGALLTPDRASELIEAGLSKINISLDGIGEVHDQLRNAPGLYQGVMDILDYLTRHTPLAVTVVSLITGINASGLPEMVRRLMTLPRAPRIAFQALVPTLGRPWRSEFYRQSPLWPRRHAEVGRVLAAIEELERLLAAGAPIINPPSQFAMWRDYFLNPLHFLDDEICRVESSLNVLADGTLTFCDHLGPVGTIADDPRAVWNSLAASDFRRRMQQCSKACNYLVNCCYKSTC